MKALDKARLIKLESGERYQRLFSRESETSGIKAGHVILKPGESIGEHSTLEREEVLIVLRGSGEAVIDKDVILSIKPDTVAYIPSRTNHDIKNTGQDIMEYIFITCTTA